MCVEQKRYVEECGRPAEARLVCREGTSWHGGTRWHQGVWGCVGKDAGARAGARVRVCRERGGGTDGGDGAEQGAITVTGGARQRTWRPHKVSPSLPRLFIVPAVPPACLPYPPSVCPPLPPPSICPAGPHHLPSIPLQHNWKCRSKLLLITCVIAPNKPSFFSLLQVFSQYVI